MSKSTSISNPLPPSPFNLAGKKGLVLGIANDHSIAWECAKIAHEQGAEIIATCLNDKARSYVQPLTDSLGIPLLNCNVEEPDALSQVVDDAARQLGQLDRLGKASLTPCCKAAFNFLEHRVTTQI